MTEPYEQLPLPSQAQLPHGLIPACFGGLVCCSIVVTEYSSAEIVLKGIESVIVHSDIIEIDRKSRRAVIDTLP